MNKFIVIEGLDGAGKSTQINLLQEHLNKKNIKFKYLHFPRTDSPIYGELVAMFLRGEFGDINSVHPYLVTLLYAGDRDNAKGMILEWLKNGYTVIVDRYVYSNIAFQCAKIEDKAEKEKLKNWIKHLEFDYNKIPVPDINLFLDVPFKFTVKKLTEERIGDDRNYLKGKKDIHEENTDFQNNVRNEYLKLVETENNFKLIDCSNNNDSILSPSDIFNKILNEINI